MSLPFPIHTVNWQQLVVLLHALNEVGGEPTKDAVINLIRERAWLKYRPDDRRPYPTQTEESWITDIAWARKSGVIAGLIRYDEWNCWEISREGRAALDELFSTLGGELVDVRKRFLWSGRFKRVFDRSYEESHMDLKAPPKGERSIAPDPEWFLSVVDIMESTGVSLFEIAKNLSTNLGFKVAPNRISIATALAFNQVNGSTNG